IRLVRSAEAADHTATPAPDSADDPQLNHSRGVSCSGTPLVEAFAGHQRMSVYLHTKKGSRMNQQDGRRKPIGGADFGRITDDPTPSTRARDEEDRCVRAIAERGEVALGFTAYTSRPRAS